MAGSVNFVCLLGRVGKDPEIRLSKANKEFATFSVATSERWRDKQSGERKESTDWHDVVVFNEGLVGVVKQFVKKGSLIWVRGKMKTRKWNANGVDRYSTEVVVQGFTDEIKLMESQGRRSPSGPDDYGSKRSGSFEEEADRSFEASERSRQQTNEELDDEIPF